MAQIKWRYILIGYSALSILALYDNVRGPLFPRLLEDFSLSNTAGSLFFSFASAAAIGGSFLAGWLLSKFNLKPTTFIGFVLMVLGPLLVGFAPSYPLILVGAILWGIAFGMVSVVQNLWVSEGAPVEYRRRMLSGLHSMYGAASVLAPTAASISFEMGLSWRHLFIGIGVLPLLSMLCFIGQGTVKVPVAPEKPTSTPTKLTAFAVVAGFYVAAELLLTTRLTLYLVTIESLEVSVASLYLAFFFAALFAGRMLFTLIPSSVSSVSVMIGSLLLSLLIVLIGLSGQPYAFVAAAIVMAPFFPVAIDYIVGLFPGESTKALSYIMGVSSIVVVVMHIFVGIITDLYGIQMAFVFDAVLLGLAALGVWSFNLWAKSGSAA